MQEIWKPLIRFNSFYEVSNYGNIKSVRRYKNNNGGKVLVNELILKQQITKKGYKSIRILFERKKYSLVVHRLVAKAFIPNPNNLPQVNHKDEVKTNNNVENLEWCNNRYNSHYSKINLNSTSKYIGVHFVEKYNKWCSQIKIDGLTYSLGYFKVEDEAKKTYDKALSDWNLKRIKPKINRNNGFFKKSINNTIIKKYNNLKEAKSDGYCISSISSSLNGNYPHNNGFYKNFIWEHDTI